MFCRKRKSEVGSEAIQNIFVDTYLKPQNAAVFGVYQLNREGSVDTLQAVAIIVFSINGSWYCAAAHCDDIVTASMQAVLNAVARSTINL